MLKSIQLRRLITAYINSIKKLLNFQGIAIIICAILPGVLFSIYTQQIYWTVAAFFAVCASMPYANSYGSRLFMIMPSDQFMVYLCFGMIMLSLRTFNYLQILKPLCYLFLKLRHCQNDEYVCDSNALGVFM